MNPKYRILHLSASDQGGAYLFAHNLVRNFHEGDVQVDHRVFSGTRQDIRLTGIKLLDKWIKFSLHALEVILFMLRERDKSIRFKFSLGYPGIPLFMLKRLTRDYDLIHLHWINKGFINIGHLRKISKPIVWTCHDIWPVTGGCHLTFGCENYKLQCGNCPFLKHPDQKDISFRQHVKKQATYQGLNMTFVSPSSWMLKNTTGSSLGTGHKHVLINNGIDTSIFKYNPRERTNTKFVVGFVAANLNDGNKSLHRLVEALSLIPGKQDYKLLLAGRQKQPFAFDIPVEYEVIQDADTSQKMADLYQQMDVLAVTSTLETFPTTLMEAACCGVSGVGFDVGGIREILEACGGSVIPPFDVAGLSNSIHLIRSQSYNRKELSIKSSGIFGIQQTVSSYQNLYKEILQAKA
jgi:glycosyltransferase involved in cell wall biosynthesis